MRIRIAYIALAAICVYAVAIAIANSATVNIEQTERQTRIESIALVCAAEQGLL